MYIDVWPGLDPSRFCVMATSQPGQKGETAKRIAFDVTIPDSLIFQTDGHAAEVSPVVEVEA
jgi:hypothetical protein